MFDLVINNAKIYDGAGTPAFFADVAIKDGAIAAVGRGIGGGATQIDAGGLALAPGFIDAHSHGDAAFDSVRSSYWKLEQGVTTEVTGSCGMSLAPVSREHLEDCLRLAGRGEAGFPLENRLDFDRYLRSMDTDYGTNVLMQIGHRMARAAASGYAARELTRSELDKLCGYIDEAMRAGAAGVSFGMIYPPGCYAPESELTEACRVVARHGGLFTIHMRNEGARLIESVEETIRIAERSGCRCVISHHKASGRENHGKTARTLELIEQANARGVEVFLDQYPYTASSTGLSVLIPGRLHALGQDKLIGMLASREGRAEIRAEIEKDRKVAPGGDLTPALAHIMIAGSRSYKELNGKMAADAARERGTEPIELLLDILREDRLRTAAIYFTMCEEDVERVMAYPRTMIGTDGLFSGGESLSHPRAFGTFTRFLGRYVRDRGLLSMEEAVRKITSMPAAVFGLRGKGLIREKMDADLTLFDPAAILDNADYAAARKNFGIKAVFVAGRAVVEDNVWNGGMYGRLLRR